MTTDVSILIVDDDDDVRAALYDELSRDYRVEAATCGEEAFAALAARTFDVVISDLKMPDHDGIEVLTFARDQDPEVIRILLTGYVDEQVHAELLKPGAPFKVGKPWYDEIDVVLRRALEQRARTRHLASSLESAIGLADIDVQLAGVGSLEELGQVLVIHLTRLPGVDIAWATCDGRRLAGVSPTLTTAGWRIEQSLDDRGRVVIGAVGCGSTAQDLVGHIVGAGQRRAGALTATAQPPVGPTRSRIDELLRHATIGTLAATLLHDMASMLQIVDGAVALLMEAATAAGDPDMIEAAADIQSTAREAFELFVSSRKFLSDGVVKAKRITATQLAQRVVRHCGSAVRERARLQVGTVAEFTLEIADTLFVRSIADIATSAAGLAPAGSTIELTAVADGDHATIAIRDDGPGVPPGLVPSLFEPLTWNRPTELPVRLAIAAYVLRCLGATVSYRREGGSCFTIVVPRQAPT